MSPTLHKRDTLNIRIKPEDRDLIDRAARPRGKNRTDFVLDAARQAELLDRTVFAVSPDVYTEFLARLDAPAQPNDWLRLTMYTLAPWDHALRLRPLNRSPTITRPKSSPPGLHKSIIG